MDRRPSDTQEFQGATLHGPLNLVNLEEAYQAITWGYDEPSFLEGCEATIEDVERLVGPFNKRYTAKSQPMVFNAAKLIANNSMPVGLLRFWTKVRGGATWSIEVNTTR